jgi:hypothetical protein
MARSVRTGKKVVGYDSRDGVPSHPSRGRIPDEWDRMSLLGDAEWTVVPGAVKKPKPGEKGTT